MKTQWLAAALIAAAGIATAATAGPLDPIAGAPGGHGPVKVLVIVSSHGLDLTSDTGADKFLSRLTAAVNQACDERPTLGPPLTLSRSAEFQTCRSQALERAMTYVQSPVVKRRYAAAGSRGGLRLANR